MSNYRPYQWNPLHHYCPIHRPNDAGTLCGKQHTIFIRSPHITLPKSWFFQESYDFWHILTRKYPIAKKKSTIPFLNLPWSSKKNDNCNLIFFYYYYDQWVDEPILCFPSIFSTHNKLSIIFNFSQFLANNIHEQFLKFQTEEVFKYTSILVYMFLYYRVNMFKFSM